MVHPTTGDIIHVTQVIDAAKTQCVAAIITESDIHDNMFCSTLFAPHGAMTDVSKRFDVYDVKYGHMKIWHSKEECPNANI